MMSAVGIVAIRRRYNKMRGAVELAVSTSDKTLETFLELDLYYPQPIQTPIAPSWIPSDGHRTAAAGASKLRGRATSMNHLV
jgi:hypothetical protein